MPNGKGVCYGDSGGPLVCKTGDRWFQYGISSFIFRKEGAKKECDPYKPSGFANVVSLLTWIEHKTGSQYLRMFIVYHHVVEYS